EPARLNLMVRRWTLLAIPLPLSWAPRSVASEHGGGGGFKFYVEISHPKICPILRYWGWLRRVSPPAETARRQRINNTTEDRRRHKLAARLRRDARHQRAPRKSKAVQMFPMCAMSRTCRYALAGRLHSRLAVEGGQNWCASWQKC